MSWSPSAAVLLLLAGRALAAGDGYMLGAGVEVDGDNDSSGALIGGVGLGEDTWLSAGLARSSVVLGSGDALDTLYSELELDHYFSPVGFRLGISFWGNSDLLASQDWHASLYWRGDRAMVAANYEFRDFELTVPATDLFPGRKVRFDADGLGMTFRFDIGESVDLRLAGVKFGYSVPFRPISDRDIARLISASRLSLMNSLDDHRSSITLGMDKGLQRWEVDAATSKSVVSRTNTRSYTLRYLRPASRRSDIEFALGYDNADAYGDVAYFSVYLYFYGVN